MVGFANAAGGRLFIGKDDNGKVVGIADTERLLEDLPNKFRDVLGVYAEINLREKKGKNYLEVIVPRYEVPISLRGKYYQRAGSTLQELKGTALNEFILKKMGKTWDDLVQESATLDEIDPQAVEYFLRRARRSGRIAEDSAEADLPTLLKNLHLTTENGKLKNAALLLFGKDPEKFFISSYFKIGRFGKTEDDLKFQDVIHGNLIQMADQVVERLKAKYLVSPIRYEGLQRIEELQYPEAALREAIFNAIVHRDYRGAPTLLRVYDDKLSIWNAGGLPEELTIEMLRGPHPSYPRNKNIAEIFFKAGFIETWGRGMALMKRECENVGLPAPTVVESGWGMETVFDFSSYEKKNEEGVQVNPRQHQALKILKEQKTIGSEEYAQIFNISDRTARRDLNELVSINALRRQRLQGRTSYQLVNE